MFMTEIQTTDCDDFADNNELFEVSIGTIILIKDAGYYMLCAVDGGHVALIGLNGGNRWDEPVEIETSPISNHSISLIDKMVSDEYEYKVVRKANISFG